MNVMRTTTPSFNRRALATQAMQAAAATRAKAKLDQVGPICIYGLCETLGVAVRFNNINMEGMYQRGIPPRRVAQVVEKALLGSRPRARYLVGPDAKAAGVLSRAAPDTVKDAVIAKISRQ